MEYDQAIAEFPTNGLPEWVHVSFSKVHNRKEALVARKMNGVTVYEIYNGKL
jgi:hypothetical protein